MTKLKKLIVLTLLMLVLAACGTDDETNSATENDLNLADSIDQTIISSNNQLGFNLLKTVDPDENGNKFISPTSLFMALSMIYNGANGETKQEIAATLELGEIDVDELNHANALLIEMINDDAREIDLNIGNSIWLN